MGFHGLQAIKCGMLIIQFLAATAMWGRAQFFVNLDFEAAIVVPGDPFFGFLDWELAVPGWRHSDGSDTSIVYWGMQHIGMGQYYLLMDSSSPVYAPGTQLAGNYSLAFASGVRQSSDPSTPWVNAFIAQTGLIPPGTRSLQLLARGPFRVVVGGVDIPMYPGSGTSYSGDISRFAGTVAEVKIINTATTIHTPTVVDNIGFSSASAPAPFSLSIRIPPAELCWDTVPNAWYQLQSRANFATNQWEAITPWLPGDGSRFCTNDTIVGTVLQRFYRVARTNALPVP